MFFLLQKDLGTGRTHAGAGASSRAALFPFSSHANGHIVLTFQPISFELSTRPYLPSGNRR